MPGFSTHMHHRPDSMSPCISAPPTAPATPPRHSSPWVPSDEPWSSAPGTPMLSLEHSVDLRCSPRPSFSFGGATLPHPAALENPFAPVTADGDVWELLPPVAVPPPRPVSRHMIAFVDPRSRRLEIERSAVTETAGLTKDETPTLCLLHMAGRCRLGPRCHQIHADVAVVSKLRRAAVARPDCCAAHGDSSREPVPANASVCVAGVTFSPSQLCMTAGLTRRARQWPSLKTADLCRVHLGGLCRHGEECRFLHVCREHAAQHLSGVVAPMQSEVTCTPKRSTNTVPYRNNPYGHHVVAQAPRRSRQRPTRHAASSVTVAPQDAPSY